MVLVLLDNLNDPARHEEDGLGLACGHVALAHEVLALVVHTLLCRTDDDLERLFGELLHPWHLGQDLLLAQVEGELGQLQLAHLRLHLRHHRLGLRLGQRPLRLESLYLLARRVEHEPRRLPRIHCERYLGQHLLQVDERHARALRILMQHLMQRVHESRVVRPMLDLVLQVFVDSQEAKCDVVPHLQARREHLRDQPAHNGPRAHLIHPRRDLEALSLPPRLLQLVPPEPVDGVFVVKLVVERVHQDVGGRITERPLVLQVPDARLEAHVVMVLELREQVHLLIHV